MPTDEVEPALTFEDKLQTTFLSQFLTELCLRQPTQFEGRAIRRCVLDVEIRTPVSTTANLIDGIIGCLGRTIKFVFSLSLDEQDLCIADDHRVGALTCCITCR